MKQQLDLLPIAESRPDFWMPFNIDDFLRDTMPLDRCEAGSYCYLQCAYWHNKGPLKNDDEILARLAKCTPASGRIKCAAASPPSSTSPVKAGGTKIWMPNSRAGSRKPGKPRTPPTPAGATSKTRPGPPSA